MNPAFVNGKRFEKQDKLVDLTQYCKRENIAFTEGEKRYYNLNHQKANYAFWRDYVNKYYENNVPEEAEIFIRSLQEEDSIYAGIGSASSPSPLPFAKALRTSFAPAETSNSTFAGASGGRVGATSVELTGSSNMLPHKI